MKRTETCVAVVLSLVLAATWSATARGQDGGTGASSPPVHIVPYEMETVEASMANATRWCLRMQDRHGAWGTADDMTPGREPRPYADEMWGLSLMSYAESSAAGVAAIKAGVTRACRADIQGQTHTGAIRILALSRLYDRLEKGQQAEVLKRVRADYEFLAEAQNKDGGWYRTKDGGSMVMCTYWPLLGLCAAEEMLGVSAMDRKSQAMWQSAIEYCTGQQHACGGFSWTPLTSNVEEPSSTVMMLAAMVTMREHLTGGQGCAGATKRLPALDKAIESGMKWLDQNYQIDPHKVDGKDWRKDAWAWGILRTAGRLGIRRLNGHDWTGEQTDACLWAPSRSLSRYVESSALFMAYLDTVHGECLVNKLKADGQEDRHPCDAAHMVRYVSAARGESVRWRVVDLDEESITMEWFSSPVLYISADEKMEFGDAQKRALRRFTDGGGMIVFDAEKAGSSAYYWWRDAVCKEVWPEWRPAPLSNGRHPRLSAERRVKPPKLMWTMDDGLRTFMVVSCRDVAKAWCHWDPKDADSQSMMDLGCNLAACATDGTTLSEWRARREVEPGGKYAEQNKSLALGSRRTITVARIEHDGEEGCLGRNYAPWERLATHINGALSTPQGVTAASTGDEPSGTPPLSLRALPPVKAGTKFAYPDAETDKETSPPPTALYLCGRSACTLDASAAAWLREYLSRGGFLLAEASLGDPAFEKPLMDVLTRAESDGGAGLRAAPLSTALAEAGLEENPVVEGRGFPLSGKGAGEPRGYNVTGAAFTRSANAELAAKADKAEAEATAAENKLLAKASGIGDESPAKLAARINTARRVGKVPDSKLVATIDAATELDMADRTLEAKKAGETVQAARAAFDAKRKEWDEERRRVKTVGHEAEDAEKAEAIWKELDKLEDGLASAQAAEHESLARLRAAVAELERTAMARLAETAAASQNADAADMGKKVLALRRAATEAAAAQRRPVFVGLFLDKRLVGLYSPYDVLFSQCGVTTYGNRGYEADDARALATNIVVLLTAR